jgi:acylphosphatase
LHAEVFGEVQGVGFRAFVVRRGMALNLTGWVRNRDDNSVELMAEGDRSRLQILLGDLHIGPSASAVERVDYSWQEHTGEFRFFSIR